MTATQVLVKVYSGMSVVDIWMTLYSLRHQTEQERRGVSGTKGNQDRHLYIKGSSHCLLDSCIEPSNALAGAP